MKLAREIAYAVASYEAELGKSASSYDIEPIIAEKLRPIREALMIVWKGDDDMTPSDMVKQYNDALELFDEADG